MPAELVFFYTKLFDGFWLMEKFLTALGVILLCHGVRWEKGQRLRILGGLAGLTLALALSNILVLFAFSKEWFRIGALVIQGVIIGIYMRYATRMDRSHLVILWCSVFAGMACTSALAWEGAYLIAGWLGNDALEPILRAVGTLALLPCTVYLRAFDFGDYPTLPSSGLISLLVCDVCVLFLSAAESLWIFTDYRITVIMVIVYACMLMVVVSVIYAMYNMCREQAEIIELQAQRHRLLSERAVASMAESNMDELRCLRHELKNQYAYMGILLREKRYDELEGFFRQMSEDFAEPMTLISSGNRIIDTVLNMELTKARRAGIPVEHELAVPQVLPFPDDDICGVLTNLLDNAIEECLRLQGRGVENLGIRLSIRPHGSYLYIVCRNTTSRTRLQWWHDALRTTKEDERLHGYGTRIVVKLARKYNGTADFSLKDGQFVAKVMMDMMEENCEDQTGIM